MPIEYIDRRCTADIHQTVKQGNLDAIHNFFLKEYKANKFDTIKLRFQDASYYLHFTFGKPEKYTTKSQLRTMLARECEGAWCEEKNGEQRYFVSEGWFFPKIRELNQEEFTDYQPTNSLLKAMKVALGTLSLSPTVSPHASGVGALLFSVLNAGPTRAQMPAFGEFRINTNTTGNQYNPTVAATEGGGFVVAWQGSQTGNTEIYGQMYAAEGPTSGSEFQINTNTTSLQASPTITTFETGDFAVAWEDFRAGNYDIYSQVYDATRATIDSEYRVNTNTTDIQRTPRIRALNDTSFILTWMGSQTGDSDIYAKIYNISRTPIGPEFRVNTNTTNIQQNPALAILKYGGFVVVWEGFQTGDYNIYGQVYDTNWTLAGPEFCINTNTTGTQKDPVVAPLDDGGFVVAWSSNQSGDYDIYGRIYDVSRAPVDSEFRINTNTTGFQTSPSLAALIGGGFVTAWQGQQTGNSDIYCIRYNATRAPGFEFRINTNTTGEQQNPTLAALKDRGFVAVWQGYQTIVPDVYGQRYDANGDPVLSSLTPSSSFTMSSTATAISSVASLSTFSMNTSQAASSSSTVDSSSASPSASSMRTSQVENSSSSQTYSSQSSTEINSTASSSSTLSITVITYETDYFIDFNGVSVGTFTITGGTGLFDATQSNTLTLHLDPDADLAGLTLTLFTLPSEMDEGDFEVIILGGPSCLPYDTQTVQNGNNYDFRIIFEGTTCSSASQLAAPFTPTL